jgi:hypothetical protein
MAKNNVLGLQEYFADLKTAANQISDIASNIDGKVTQVAQATANGDVTRDNANATGAANVAGVLSRKGPGGIPAWAMLAALAGFYFLVMN